MAVAFGEQPFTSLRQEVGPLLSMHWLESAADYHVPLDMHWEYYAAIEKAGCEVCVTAREWGALVGYAVCIMQPSLHHRGRLLAQTDLYYLVPAFRRGLTGFRLLRAAEDACVREGADELFLNIRVGRGRNAAPLAQRMGMRPVDALFWKRLD
jgi:GNAT superfamily N-acetyltransferase